ncbi:glycoside hydrolase family 6 protein [Blastococcus atacamensis]|uniref:glycoside hydrolase family 6 protein n=1 Tax=Blastococcus atacamensis TaxID=2070508 RepID=UPI0012FFDEBF|nr:glycoside hydrolase family 6 protein [Blastococcus atacamensis]
MTAASKTRRVAATVAAATLSLAGVMAGQVAHAANDVLDPSTELFANPESTTLEAAQGLTGQARADAQLLGSFPSADWFTKGTPLEVEAAVAEVVASADATDEVPVLVAYNVPFRDCAQYSAGGATSVEEYKGWIDGFAAGIGTSDATVILEPDGLGIIPHYTTLDGNTEWCQPEELDADTAAAERFEMLNYAVDALAALPNTATYLDGTHSGWLGVGEITDRLIKAGVEDADGFFLNASNYVATERLQKYGTWISDCIHLSQGSRWEPSWCASQYYPANPSDLSTWGQSDAAYDKAYADTSMTRNPAEQAHFVIDTSRNGQGSWTPPAGFLNPLDWCNPPGRGAGLTPTTDTGNALIDAYLWIKVPGESDGSCYRGSSAPHPGDQTADPAAGQWFPEQARELIALANPPIAAPTCHVSYTVHGSWREGFNTQIWIKNTGTEPVNGWELEWAFHEKETIQNLWSGSATQQGAYVEVDNLSWNRTIKPGQQITLGFIGETNGSPVTEPWLFTLNGAGCTSD